MEAKLASIIVLNYNGERLLTECLDAVLRQDYPNYEVIVVDNGSTDGSAALAREKFPTIRFHQLPSNFGFCGGNNRGIEIARGEYIALLNNDAVPETPWLRELVRGLEQDPTIGSCASKMLVYGSENVIDTAGGANASLGLDIWHGRGRSDGLDYSQPRYVFNACAGAALYRRSMIEEIGCFDEAFFFSYEDVDLSFRAQLAGYKCLYVPTAVVHHHVTGTLRDPAFRDYLSYRNSEYVYFKNMPGRLFWKYFPERMIFSVCVFVKQLLKGRALNFLRAKMDFFRNLPKVLRKRSFIQKNRKVSNHYLESMMLKGYLAYRIRLEFRPKGR